MCTCMNYVLITRDYEILIMVGLFLIQFKLNDMS